MKDQLTRLDRIYEKDPIFFITCCTPERKKTRGSDSIHHSFQNFCQSVKERHSFLGRYVIMPDHLHFFLHLAESMKLSIWIKSLKNSLSKTLPWRGRLVNGLFRAKFFLSVLIDSSDGHRPPLHLE
jgi:REP element-mobilizing transposase RayT